MNIQDILLKEDLDKKDLISLMNIEDEKDLLLLYDRAYTIKEKYVGKKVYYRGLIEFSNICKKDCDYCGIRRSNKNTELFMMSKEEILKSARWIYENNYGSLVLQAGERDDKEFVDFVEDVLKAIKKRSSGELGITLSLGEQTKETYKRWFEAGAHRYLLRIESSNEKIYEGLHPKDETHSYSRRIECLGYLKEVGYQVGTGVMIGLPDQTTEDLVDDIMFYKNHDIDMIGMGPYIIHDETPMGKKYKETVISKEERVKLGLKMIAITRIYLKDVNIAATTALQGLDPLGREKGLKAGANILMPVTTAAEHRAKYQLYNDKPCIDDTAEQCKKCLAGRVGTVGDEIAYGEWGDSPHFKNRQK